MKRLFIFIGICCLSLNIMAQEQKQEQTVTVAPTYSEQELTFLKEQYKMLIDQNIVIVKELKEERKNHQDFVECIYRWVFVLAVIVGVILSFFGWRTKKDVVEKVKNEWDTSLKQLALELNTQPEALKEAVQSKIDENRLKSDYSLKILYKGEEISKANDMEKLLFSSGFKKVKKLSDNEDLDNFTKNDVIILFSDITNDELKRKIKESGCAIFGCGERTININNLKEYVSNKDCVTCCNSLATLYQNLISLLYYKKEVDE
ncbi:MAG: hypothetical protein LBS55_14100 [Prevotellaceae bacterium]|jgi:PleD family two-component response regulator|nr:hypothetical protein [Prevotellaceae bacterium]